MEPTCKLLHCGLCYQNDNLDDCRDMLAVMQQEGQITQNKHAATYITKINWEVAPQNFMLYDKFHQSFDAVIATWFWSAITSFL